MIRRYTKQFSALRCANCAFWNQQKSSKPTDLRRCVVRLDLPNLVSVLYCHLKNARTFKTWEVRHPDCEYYSVSGGMTPCTLVRPSILNGVTSLIKTPARYPHLVDIMTRLRAELSTIRIPVGAIYLSLPKNFQTGSGAHLASHAMDIGGLSLE